MVAMLSLAETQTRFRRAIGADNGDIAGTGIIAPGNSSERLAIYRRHFRESFRRHLRGRFPTLEWLLGTPRMIELADAVIRAHPPRKPSLAEYGSELASALAGELGEGFPPYLSSVAWMDWHLGNAAVSVVNEPLSIASLASVHADKLGDTVLVMQRGAFYLAAEWPVDTLLGLRLSKNAPDRLEFEPEQVWLELRGARGAISFKRLDAGSFAFQSSLRSGKPLGSAAESGLCSGGVFDIPAALAALFSEGLVIALHPSPQEVPNA
jgi:hypothetical protein